MLLWEAREGLENRNLFRSLYMGFNGQQARGLGQFKDDLEQVEQFEVNFHVIFRTSHRRLEDSC